MWRLKQFMPKEQTGLEGRTIDIGNLKVHVRNAIAEGGFSCVYLARDALHGSKQYALKHIICNDDESLDLVKKEINTMKSLRGHPNIVTLCSYTILDMGRTKEALLVMEYCEKSLVNVLESRGAGYFEEKQIFIMFRDICNAVFAMHCLSPPIAHRDLKAENLLLGPDGLWKLCDFGSISTNHKRFEKPEEMGIEEDNIRKHTTPAYRAPEMWDLFRRELINEKVDIWALGCLLFRICYFKLAFDGESKLQILNGNYRVPDLPKYSTSITGLIRDLLQSSPDARPDITQVWFRVNNLLPEGLQKSLPDRTPEVNKPATEMHEGSPNNTTHKSQQPMPRRSPPPPPSSSVNTGGSGGQLGAFWVTDHAKELNITDDNSKPKFDEDQIIPKWDAFPQTVINPNVQLQEDGLSKKEFEAKHFNIMKSGKEEELEVEIEKLKKQLKQAYADKDEIQSKFDKLSAICRSQRQELQELKQELASRTPSPNTITDSSKDEISPPPIEGTVWELEKGLVHNTSPIPDQKPWKAAKLPVATSTNNNNNSSSISKSVRTRNDSSALNNNNTKRGQESWGFGTESSFTALPGGSPNLSKQHIIKDSNNSQRSSESKKPESSSLAASSQPAGWAGF
ncbi:probable serine/threonine-protein kinase DDB_G0276461 [Impatiens glandulifera]|uniref:probable serine/threonine-protein kinase DDB_G0276461 n=1 Tax=Impatiens glandulifera TaxID=253017 RepID=UPI001FB133DA|nr:probable serine/threonine-protein kinase DDB_G0276461 [Impatiens glandulifera]